MADKWEELREQIEHLANTPPAVFGEDFGWEFHYKSLRKSLKLLLERMDRLDAAALKVGDRVRVKYHEFVGEIVATSPKVVLYHVRHGTNEYLATEDELERLERDGDG